MPDVHAKLSASGAKKWMNCPGSIDIEADIPDQPSEFAEEGTTAHALGEAKIRFAVNQLTRAKFHNAIKDLIITEDMAEYTDSYSDFVIEEYNAAKQISADALLYVEQKLDFSEYVPGGFGTGDVVLVSDGKLHIIDLKYGQGVRVSANNNPQLKLYALGALSAFDYLYDIKSIRMTIYQPRIDNICTAIINAHDLLKWGEDVVIPAAKAANDVSNNNLCAGAHCDDGFCKARPLCRAYAEERQRAAVYDFSKNPPTLKQPATLTAEEISSIIDQSAQLKKWSELVSNYALDQALNNGIKYPGFKLVEGRSNRKYAENEADIGRRLIHSGIPEEDIFTKKLRGISDMEKYLGKRAFKELLGDSVIKPPGKPTLVHIEDKRPELNSANDDFKNIIEN